MAPRKREPSTGTTPTPTAAAKTSSRITRAKPERKLTGEVDRRFKPPLANPPEHPRSEDLLSEEAVARINERMYERRIRSQADLARKASQHGPTIRRNDVNMILRRYRAPSLRTARALAAALDWTVEELLGYAPAESEEREAPHAAGSEGVSVTLEDGSILRIEVHLFVHRN